MFSNILTEKDTLENHHPSLFSPPGLVRRIECAVKRHPDCLGERVEEHRESDRKQHSSGDHFANWRVRPRQHERRNHESDKQKLRCNDVNAHRAGPVALFTLEPQFAPGTVRSQREPANVEPALTATRTRLRPTAPCEEERSASGDRFCVGNTGGSHIHPFGLPQPDSHDTEDSRDRR